MSLSLFAVFAPQELFYNRADADMIASSTPPAIVATTSQAILPESLEEMSDRIAIENGINLATLRNLVTSESGWDPSWVSDTGDVGLVQINIDIWHVTKAQALDPEYSLEFAAKKIRAGQESYWTVCNCYSLVKVKIPSLPRMADVVPNSTPHVGAVAIFYYGSVKHIAYVTNIAPDGFEVTEANITPCLVAPRYIKWNDPHLRGFWSQKNDSI